MDSNDKAALSTFYLWLWLVKEYSKHTEALDFARLAL